MTILQNFSHLKLLMVLEMFGFNPDQLFNLNPEIQTDTRTFSCFKCDKKFETEEALLAHLKTHERVQNSRLSDN